MYYGYAIIPITIRTDQAIIICLYVPKLFLLTAFVDTITGAILPKFP